LTTYQASFRFYAELTDFLGGNADSGRLVRVFDESPSVKDQIEACGVPHTEVDLILVNGVSVDFGYRLSDGDYVSVYPVFESFDISSLSQVRPAPLRELQFVVDVNLGKLARLMRLLGFDAVCDGHLDDAALVDVSVEQHRVLLTKDRGLLKRSAVTHGYFVRGVRPEAQLLEVTQRFDLIGLFEPFARCMECNGTIVVAEKADIEHLLEPLTRRYFDEFRRCLGCERIYWKGSHFERLVAIIDDVRTAARVGMRSS